MGQLENTDHLNQPSRFAFSVFTKPWKSLSIDNLAAKVQSLGFDGIEFPVREGFQVQPEQVEKELPRLSSRLKAYGLHIYSIASTTEEAIFAACAESGVPLIRIMVDVDFKEGYWASEKRIKSELEKLQVLCQRYRIKVGIQQHIGRTRIKNAFALHRILDGLDPNCFGAIWDAAHDALTGERHELSLDVVAPYLCMVNLKNGYYQRVNGNEAEQAQWEPYWSTARQGMASWPSVIDNLIQRDYKGVLCLTAEYSDELHVDDHIAADIAYVKSLVCT
ncbi:TIM barrel protein [Paenibacillus qinlingensis]|uniref:Sugar phosphate isomerase/epimerase n=1 Tax=Paenibacillus qinlingensis TaxID=1837343 RepID=A0ABU1NRH4_9BACL|nr:TIM barrel protein [Paenibacillus qinlingensis]MDR6550081.1 sugar phosphate isomerase/epimerase [Paenibacillus qinlingensis]